MILTELTPFYPVELLKEDRKHFYKVTANGEVLRFPGVTGILSIIGGDKTGALIGWAKKLALNSVRAELTKGFDGDIEGLIKRASKMPEQTLDAAADFGTRLHDAADAYIKGLPVTLDADLEQAFLAFKKWLESSGIEIIMGDTAVASLEWQYGGKFDFLFKKDGHYGIGDFKTSGGCRLEYSLQVAAYGQATSETYGIPVRHGLVVRFDKKTPTFETKWVKDMEFSFAAFLSAKMLKDRLGEEYLYA